MQVELFARGQWMFTASSRQPASKFEQSRVYRVPKAKQGIIGISRFRVRRLLSSSLGNNEGRMMGSPQRRLTVEVEVIYASSHGSGDYVDAPAFL
jgi:hypothetical protein